MDVFEQNASVGGVWKYSPTGVMYKSLVSNLPRQVMQISEEFPFAEEVPAPTTSYVTHSQVQVSKRDTTTADIALVTYDIALATYVHTATGRC